MDEKVKLDAVKLIELGRAAAEEMRERIVELKGARGFFAVIRLLPRLAMLVVKRAEEIGRELKLVGPDKKALAVEMICWLVPDSFLPDSLVEILAGFAIERALPSMRAQQLGAR